MSKFEGVGVIVHQLDRSTCHMHIVPKNNQAAVDSYKSSCLINLLFLNLITFILFEEH